MRKAKKIVSVLLGVTMMFSLLAACNKGGGGQGEVTYGRYVEKDISPEGMKGYPTSLISLGNGVLELVTNDWGDEENNYQQVMYRWRSDDNGASWKSINMDWTKEYTKDYSEYYEKNQTPPEEVYLSGFYPLENGDLIFQINRYVNDPEKEISTSSTEIWRMDMEGNKTPFSLPEYEQAKASGKDVSINQIATLPGNRLYIAIYTPPSEEDWDNPNFDYSTTETRGVYDASTGEKIYDVKFEGAELFFNETTLFSRDYDGKLSAFNLADGSPSEQKLPSQELMQKMDSSRRGSVFVDNSNNFYSISARGMNKLAPEGTEIQQVMDGLNYTYGSPLFGINNLIYNSKDSSIILSVFSNMGESNESKLLHYVWDDKAIASSDQKIKVYSLYDNYSVRLALSEFKRQNPDVTIEYETAFAEQDTPNLMGMGTPDGGSSGGSGLTVEDALRALNTELLNGTGPDVLVLDGLPAESFAAKGILEDITDVVNGQQGLISQIIEPMKLDGKIRMVPTSFTMPILMGEKGYVEQFTSLSGLVDAIEQGAGKSQQIEFDENWTQEQQEEYYRSMYGPKPPEEQPVMNFNTLENVFNSFYDTSAPAIFDSKNGINEQELRSFFESVKRISDKYELTSSENMQGMAQSGMAMGYASYSMSDTVEAYTSRRGRLGLNQLGSFQVLSMANYNILYSGQPDMKGIPENAAESIVPEEEQASAETQPEEKLPAMNPQIIYAPGEDSASGTFMPKQMLGVVSNSKQKDLAKQLVSIALSDAVQKYDLGNGFPVSKASFESMYQEYLKMSKQEKESGLVKMEMDYEALFASMKTPYYTNEYIQGVIYKPMQDYCSGSMTLDAAVAQVLKETELYFAERN